ncbi:hypothetical protein V1283_003197 [Bradyrhizobium sp. AZCC 2262]
MAEHVTDDSSGRKKGPPAFGGPSLGRNALRSKAPLEPVTRTQWQEIVSGRLRSNRKMAAGRFLRNRRGEVSSRYREAPRSPVHAGGPSANLFGSLTTHDAPLLLRTHSRPGPWKLRRLDWKDCRARHRTRRHWADCRNRIARTRTNGLHPSVDALASTSCLHFCRTDQSKTEDCHFQRLCHPSIAQLSCGVTS